ncbi:MAG: amidohydrolase family protein [Cohaesibacteraceae bacterium]
MQPLLDTHQHLLYPDKLPYGWAAGVDALAGRAFTLDDYKALTTGLGVERTVFMEVAVDDDRWREEAPFIANFARQSGSDIAGLIATIRPESEDGFQADLESADSLGIVGFRRILHEIEDGVSQTQTFRANVRRIGDAGKTFDMCFLARQLPIARDLAMACDNTTLVLDHCGVPDIAGGALDPWRSGTKALADLPNVHCKLSGILAYCDPQNATLEAIRPYVEHVREAFGPDRMVWGSDWPVVNITSDLPQWIAMTRTILSDLSPDERAKIASQNAVRLYKLD